MLLILITFSEWCYSLFSVKNMVNFSLGRTVIDPFYCCLTLVRLTLKLQRRNKFYTINYFRFYIILTSRLRPIQRITIQLFFGRKESKTKDNLY